MFLTLKALFQKSGTSSAILAIALLVAILASVTSVVSHLNYQTEAISRTRDIGETFLIMNQNSTNILNSQVNPQIASTLNNIDAITYVLPQKIFNATLIVNSNNYSVLVRGVNASRFLAARHAYVNGSIADGMQANVGEILSRLASITEGDEIDIAVNGNAVKVETAGIIRTFTQSDTELIVPMSVVDLLIVNNGEVSVIEFAITSGNNEEAMYSINELLPTNVKIVKVQQTKTFVQELNSQTLNFLNLWFLAVYAIIIASSYVIATRLIVESRYELAMLRALGARRISVFQSILIVAVAISLLGFVLGIALGVSGAQILSTIAKLTWKDINISPFVNIEQVVQIALLTVASSIIGCMYPAVKAMRKISTGLTL